MSSTERWNAVYGATVALLVQKHIDEGKGYPDDIEMKNIIADAQVVATDSEDVIRIWHMEPSDERQD